MYVFGGCGGGAEIGYNRLRDDEDDKIALFRNLSLEKNWVDWFGPGTTAK